jgi:hypothetical protein
VANPLNTRKGFWTFAVVVWIMFMLVGVIGVGVLLHASVGGLVFVACLLTVGEAVWLWIFRRLTR